jgi:HAD superfamily hydrolase (TIGR01509 family)
MSIKALIFDFDGTILDTETPEFITWQALYQRYNQVLDPNDWGKGIGTWGAFDPWQDLEQKVGTALPKETLQLEHRTEVLKRIAASSLLAGTKELMLEAKATGLKLAIASSSDHDWVSGWTQQHGILEYFDALATRYEVEHVKPDPALFLLALQKLKLEPQQAIVLEDSPNGCKAALAAGIPCIAIPNSVTQTLEFPSGVIKIPSLAGISLQELTEKIRQSA